MIPRFARSDIDEAPACQAAVAIIWPHQVGKTTLALGIADGRPSVYLDLETPEDRAKLQEPAALNAADRVAKGGISVSGWSSRRMAPQDSYPPAARSPLASMSKRTPPTPCAARRQRSPAANSYCPARL